MEIRIIEGPEAEALLAREDFLRAWRALHDGCPWATGFQTPAFACAWYDAYAASAAPLLVVGGAGGSSEPEGLLVLAQETGSGRILHVGDHQAEYHAWLARPDGGNAFIVAALAALRARFPQGALVFRYLPPDAPAEWLHEGAVWHDLVSIREVRRPFIRLGDGQQIEATLRKKSNKSRLNRLRKVGGDALTFGTLTSETELAAVIDELARHYDLRQGAINGVTPFHDDACKKRFYLNLMASGLLHAFVFRAGEALAAAILSVKSGETLSIGVFAHSVLLARHSPGKFGVLFLCREALGEGRTLVDLTPGGPWKERFANDGDTVREVTVRFDKRAASKAARTQGALTLMKRALALVGATPQTVRDATATIRQAAPATAKDGGLERGLIALTRPLAPFGVTPRAVRNTTAALRRAPAAIGRRFRRWAYEHREFRVYYYEVERIAALTSEVAMKRDDIDDLLRFEATSPWLSRAGFMARALRQLENGSHVYTSATDDRLAHLAHYGWLNERESEARFTEVDATFTYPPNSAVLFDFYTHPQARGRGLYQRAIRQMLKDAAAVPGTERVYISVMANNGPSRHVIEKLGFVYDCSLHRRCRFGRVTHQGPETAPSQGAREDRARLANLTAS